MGMIGMGWARQCLTRDFNAAEDGSLDSWKTDRSPPRRANRSPGNGAAKPAQIHRWGLGVHNLRIFKSLLLSMTAHTFEILWIAHFLWLVIIFTLEPSDARVPWTVEASRFLWMAINLFIQGCAWQSEYTVTFWRYPVPQIHITSYCITFHCKCLGYERFFNVQQPAQWQLLGQGKWVNLQLLAYKFDGELERKQTIEKFSDKPRFL